MTPTYEIRGRLNELGIEYEVTSDSCTTARIGGIEYKFMEYAIQGPSDGANGKVFIITDYLTPEQAIAATVGARDYTYDEWRAINEAVGDAMEYAHEHAVMYPDKADPLWNIDEYVNRVLEVAYGPKDATTGAGTCRNIAELNREGVSGYFFVCSECGLAVHADRDINKTNYTCRKPDGSIDLRTFNSGGKYKFERCPRCGRKVTE